jgi:hypothetical protein
MNLGSTPAVSTSQTHLGNVNEKLCNVHVCYFNKVTTLAHTELFGTVKHANVNL